MAAETGVPWRCESSAPMNWTVSLTGRSRIRTGQCPCPEKRRPLFVQRLRHLQVLMQVRQVLADERLPLGAVALLAGALEQGNGVRTGHSGRLRKISVAIRACTATSVSTSLASLSVSEQLYRHIKTRTKYDVSIVIMRVVAYALASRACSPR